MIGELSNHLWQTTIFVAGAALVAAALRRNGAHVRHLVWLAASLKFLVPFALLLTLGSQWAWTRPAAAGAQTPAIETVSVVMDQIAQPFTGSASAAAATPVSRIDWVPISIFAIWAFGFAAILLFRLRGWARIRTALRSSTPLRLPIPDCQSEDSPIADSSIVVRSCAGVLEPGVVGLWRPVLLLPAGISDHLTPAQMEAVLAHELCHIRRHDNVTAAIHMIVEAVFWFHPLVWWIGARMVDERERACDEHVLRVLGKPEAYAEGILNVCKLYVESPLTCVSGVTGSNLKKRIEAIMVNRVGLRLNLVRRIAIATAAVCALVAPVVVGMITAPIRIAAQEANGPERFEVVSIKPCAAPGPSTPGTPGTGGGRGGGSSAPWHAQTSPGRVFWDCATLSTLVDQAYADLDHPLLNMIGDSRPPTPTDRHPKRVRGGPSWIDKDTFTVEVKGPVDLTAPALAGAARKNLATLPAGMSHALRAALEARFQLKVHRATEQQDMYALQIAAKGLSADRMKPTKPGDCVTRPEYAAMDPVGRASLKICGDRFITMISWEITGGTLRNLAEALSSSMDRYVLDETKTAGTFNFVVQFRETMNDSGGEFDLRVVRALDALGLKIQPTKNSAEYLVIDRAEQPAPDSAFAAQAESIPQSTAAKFEVASIKPCPAEAPPAVRAGGGPGGGAGPGGGSTFSATPGRVHVECAQLAWLVDTAYIQHDRGTNAFDGWAGTGSAYNSTATGPRKVRGGPSWVSSERWTIEAKAATGADEDMLLGPMLRALLEDRFQLKLRTESEEAAMWTLGLAKGGLKIKPMKDGDCNPDRTGEGILVSRAIKEGIKPTCGMVSAAPNGANWRWEHGGRNLGSIASMLSVDLGAAVLDRTGVTDKFNIVFEYGPDENTPKIMQVMERFAPGSGLPTAANIFTALEEQLGLKLEKTKGSRSYIVIDRAEKPAPNDAVGGKQP